MYEVELKLRADHEQVRERLGELDSTHVGAVSQVDTYYDAPDREFAATDEALRIRRETRRPQSRGGSDDTARDTRVLLTYKGPLVDAESKSRAEAETQVTDGEELRRILDGLGYEPAATVHKERDRYSVGDCRVTLDRVEGLGEFVEVEYRDPVDEATIDHARRTATDLLESLELDAGDAIRTSYLGLLIDRE